MNLRLLAAAVVAATCLFAAPSRAKECVELGTFEDVAVGRIRKHPNVRLFCEACGDTVATPFQVAAVRVVRAAGPPSELDLTDRAGRTRRVPITSVYVQRDPKEPIFSNVANQCEIVSVTTDTIGPLGPFPAFDAQAVAKTLGAVDLTHCRSPVGAEDVQARILFDRSGRVVYAIALPPYAGTDTGRCVAFRLSRVRVAPFSGKGKGKAVVQTFSVPSK